jgi:hypothetical protein
VPSPSSLNSTSWHIPTVPDTSTAGSQASEQPAYTNPAYDFTRPGHYHHGREFFPPSRGYYDARALEHPLEPPSASTQFASPRGMIDQRYPATTAYPVTYTDDAGLKLCDRVRRQCFNCKATTTTTWRRSMLSPGKLVRSHASVRRNKPVLTKKFDCRFATSAGCLSGRTQFRGRRHFRADAVPHVPLRTRTRMRTLPLSTILNAVIITTTDRLCHSLVTFPAPLAPRAVKRAHRTRHGCPTMSPQRPPVLARPMWSLLSQ